MNFGMIMLSQSIRKMHNCYIDTNSFIIHLKTEDFYKGITNDTERRFETSNYDLTRPLPQKK